MRVFAPRELAPGERRVAITPDSARRLGAAGLEVSVERGAGLASTYDDDAYRVRPPSEEEAAQLGEGTVLVGLLQPADHRGVMEALRARNVTVFPLELLPRISRAQSMDALSSQASLAGYKAVLLGANRLGKYFPMLMSAAGTIAPARVLVLGAGVAGLQAIATARRLGAVVEAYDVRPAVKEEVHSLGATFLELELEAREGSGGYAGAQSEEFLTKQRELLGARVAAADVVVTTAAIPGRRSPVLVTGDMVEGMRRGSVLVDLASEGGGNCELTRPGEVFETEGGVAIDGTTNLPSLVPVHASQLYARNVATFIQSLVKDGELTLDFEDQVTRDTCLAHQGEWVSERGRQLMGEASS
jgi:NAD(P) transhydrogenase subunit alpha